MVKRGPRRLVNWFQNEWASKMAKQSFIERMALKFLLHLEFIKLLIDLKKEERRRRRKNPK